MKHLVAQLRWCTKVGDGEQGRIHRKFLPFAFSSPHASVTRAELQKAVPMKQVSQPSMKVVFPHSPLLRLTSATLGDATRTLGTSRSVQVTTPYSQLSSQEAKSRRNSRLKAWD
ncbi:hypothetical protein LC653_30670 [Nostoc sp. CHAB 5784]|uniref:hypothetical protein n=1 Tax=Nostoc mirabile TaxID=2907820 RepID=UPI001E4014DB|nr:hypothetical protein [Nostoc mirabile]MCC5668120.1 hypothetical protein [Nostoc mirabile CHAB5784]